MLVSFPVDDATLLAVEHSLGASLHFEEGNPEPIVVGADYSFNKLMDFLSGYDESLLVLEDDGSYGIPCYTYTGGPVYHYSDVIKALITEVRFLRQKI